MSYHYEVVISCFLTGRTPEPVLDTLRWLCDLKVTTSEDSPELSPGFDPSGLHDVPDDDEDFPYQTLRPDPDSYLAGGEIARLRSQIRGFNESGDVVEWGFYARTLVLDDDMGEIYRILELIAPYVSDDGYGGHEREHYDSDQVSLYLFSGGTERVKDLRPAGVMRLEVPA
ncbi:hypothetical protein, partial [Actinoplanes utahensis]